MRSWLGKVFRCAGYYLLILRSKTLTRSENIFAGKVVMLKSDETLRTPCASNAAKLASLPGTLGRPRPDIRPDLRSFPYKGYIIFFRYLPDVFEVVNILEGHRDLATYFIEPGVSDD